MVTFIKVVDLALMVCICNYILIPKLLYKKRYWLFTISFIVMVVSSSLLKMQLLGRVMNSAFLLDWNTGWKVKIYDNVLPHFFLVLAGAAFKLMIDAVRMQNRMASIAKEKAEAELAYLKQQINPHFLFNALNTVYFQIDKTNTAARSSLHQLSEMLRYQLYEARENRIPVEKEIQYLQDYIRLQSQRQEAAYKIEFTVAPDVKGFFIEPFLLLPFVENCFKHLSHFNDAENFISININMQGEMLVFSSVNSFEKNEMVESRNGIGISNTSRRLELLYPAAHELTVRKDADRFYVTLKLNVHASR